MSDYSQIKKMTKALKLSGLSDTIELRIMEAQQNQLAYTELLGLLFQDEMETRKNRKLNRLTAKAKLKNNQTLEGFDFSINPSINAAAIRELSTCRFIEKGENVFFIGATGVGKTHLAMAIAHNACRKFLKVESHKFSSLFTEITYADLNNKLHNFLKPILSADLLIIDDFAFKKLNQQAAELLYTIVDARYLQKSTIITSNRAISDWMNIFPDHIMANAILDRLAHNAHQIYIKGESYRKKMKPILQSGKV